MIEHIPELVEAGIDSLKVEGRMKTALYIATMTRTYRKAIDDYFTSEERYRGNMDWYREEIGKCTYRQFTTGFYFGKPTRETQIYDNSTYVNEYIHLGIIEEVAAGGSLPRLQEAEWGRERREENVQGFSGQQKTEPMEDVALALFEQRNKFCVGDLVEIMKPDGRNVPVTVEAMYNEEGEAVESCPHARQKIWIRLSEAPALYDLLRVANGGRAPKP